MSSSKVGNFQSLTFVVMQTGTIILQHEIDDYTMGKAMEYYPSMKSAFKYLVPVAVALNKTTPYVEKNVEFPTFNECSFAALYSSHPCNLTSPPS